MTIEQLKRANEKLRSKIQTIFEDCDFVETANDLWLEDITEAI